MPGVKESVFVFWRNTSGAAASQVALLIPLFLGLTALAVDTGFFYVTRNKLQIAADAAALAGASALPDEVEVKARAVEAAEQNMPPAAMGNVLVEDDVVLGNWDSGARIFTAASDGGAPVNAVQVLTLRHETRGNAQPSVLAGVFGISLFNVRAGAVALGAASNDCFSQGLVADGIVEIGSTDEFGPGACLHGQDGVKVGSQNTFSEGAVISMPDEDLLVQGSDNEGLDDAIKEQNLEPTAALEVSELLNQIESGSAELPPFLTGAISVVSSIPSTPTAGTLYVVNNDVDLSSRPNLSGFGVYITNSSKKIVIGSGTTIRNMLFASEGMIETGSNLTIGDADYCSVGAGANVFIAQKYIKFGSNITMRGIQLIAGTEVAGDKSKTGIEFGSNVTMSGIGGQSAGLIKIGSNPVISVCDRADHIYFGNVNKKLSLVD